MADEDQSASGDRAAADAVSAELVAAVAGPIGDMVLGLARLVPA
jgi:hypothetical protein